MKLLSLLATCGVVSAVGTTVDLGYAKYQGRIVGDGTTQWLGMRYAAPPVGKLRFVAPQEPVKVKGVQSAEKFGNICVPQSPDDWTMKPNPRFTLGEDCLFVNVFAPSNATEKSKLPVMFYIQGGGFTSDSGANYNGSDLARRGNMIVVSINYRVGQFGFLLSQEVLDGDADTNNAIRDQIMALKWTKKNIKKFGGNPDHIVLNGASAGASSIVILLASPASKGKDLYKGIIAESTAIGQVKTLNQAQAQYDCLVKETGCANQTGIAPLDCLKALNASQLQTRTCQFSLTFDKDIIPSRFLLNRALADTISRTPSIFGSTLDEGTDFAPKNLNTSAEFRYFLLSYLPFLSDKALDDLYAIYATPDQPVFPNSGLLWRPASNVIGDIGFKCATRAFAGSTSWVYNFGPQDPELAASGTGVAHTIEINAIWGPNNTDGNPPKSYLPGRENEHLVPLMQGYVTSFVRWLDPNRGRAVGTPVWEKGIDGRKLFVGGPGETKMAPRDDVFEKRCERLWPVLQATEVLPEAGTKVDLAEV